MKGRGISRVGRGMMWARGRGRRLSRAGTAWLEKAIECQLHIVRLGLLLGWLLLLLLLLLPPQPHAAKPPHAVSHGLNSRQACHTPHTSMHVRWGPGQPDVSQTHRGRGRRRRCRHRPRCLKLADHVAGNGALPEVVPAAGALVSCAAGAGLV